MPYNGIPSKISLKPKRHHGYFVVIWICGMLLPPLGEFMVDAEQRNDEDRVQWRRMDRVTTSKAEVSKNEKLELLSGHVWLCANLC
jgi:hypothetical protein